MFISMLNFRVALFKFGFCEIEINKLFIFIDILSWNLSKPTETENNIGLLYLYL